LFFTSGTSLKLQSNRNRNLITEKSRLKSRGITVEGRPLTLTEATPPFRRKRLWCSSTTPPSILGRRVHAGRPIPVWLRLLPGRVSQAVLNSITHSRQDKHSPWIVPIVTNPLDDCWKLCRPQNSVLYVPYDFLYLGGRNEGKGGWQKAQSEVLVCLWLGSDQFQF
jgi:hypothetical protein